MKPSSHLLFPALALFSLCSVSHAAPSVKFEQVIPASPQWEFKNIPKPSQSDVAHAAKVDVANNQLEPLGGVAAVLVDGKIPNNSLDIKEEALFTNANSDDGSLIIDLGKNQAIAAINTYSWHENPSDQGARGPQVYTVSASTDSQTWTKLADVDTRPNKDGNNWNGQHGASVTDSTGKLGDFRYVKFDIQRTRSPLQNNVNHTGTIFSEIDIHTKATLAKAGDAKVIGPVQVTDVWVIFKTHCDIGYTDTIENVLKKFRVNMMDQAISIFEQDRANQNNNNQQFSWMLAGWPLKHVLGPEQDPERRKKIEQAVREGKLGIGAIPFSLHSETGGLEDTVRGLGYASQIARKYDRPLPIAAKMTDVPCHSWIWPTVLKHSGVQFLQLGCNHNSGHLELPHLFWWQGPDGSRILCNFTQQYGSSIIPPRGWPAKNYLAVIMTHDNHGPPTAQDIENLRQHAAKYLPGVRVHFGSLDDYARAIAKENPDLPVVKGDMPDTWIHGWMSMPIEAKAVRNIRPLQPVLDILNTQLKAWEQPVKDVSPALADAYEFSNLYSEHTFGPSGTTAGVWQTGLPRDTYGEEFKKARASGALKKYESGFDDKRAFAFNEEKIVQHALSENLDLLAKAINSNGKRTVIFNGLPWKRSGFVEIDGKSVFVKDVPAGGYLTLTDIVSDQPALATLKDNTLDTKHYKITLDLERGGLRSLLEKKSGRELVDQASPYAFGQYLHERFDAKHMSDWHLAYSRPRGGQAGAFVKTTTPKDLTYAQLAPKAWKATVTTNGSADILTLTAGDTLGIAEGIAVVFTLPRQVPTIDVECRLTNKIADPTPEGGWICLPFAVENPAFKLSRLGGAIDPTKDIVDGANKDLICLYSGMTISGDNGTGIGLCPLDSPVVSLGKPGLWKYTKGEINPKSSVFIHLYNNMWHTNFPEWIEGSWSSRVRIWNGTELTTPATEALTPLLIAQADGPAGSLPTSQAGLSISHPGVLATAFGKNPDGAGTLLRLWEQNGQACTVEVTIPGNFTNATPVDLRGEATGDSIPLKNGKLSIDLGANAPASFILK